jgi:hypothetical protein
VALCPKFDEDAWKAFNEKKNCEKQRMFLAMCSGCIVTGRAFGSLIFCLSGAECPGWAKYPNHNFDQSNGQYAVEMVRFRSQNRKMKAVSLKKWIDV